MHRHCQPRDGGSGWLGSALVQHRGNGIAPDRDLRPCHAGQALRVARGSSRLTPLRTAGHTVQHHHRAAARKMPRTEPGRQRLAVHARQLAVQPRVPVLRRHCRPLLPRLEQARRSALARHVSWITGLGHGLGSVRLGIRHCRPLRVPTERCHGNKQCSPNENPVCDCLTRHGSHADQRTSNRPWIASPYRCDLQLSTSGHVSINAADVAEWFGP